MSRLPLAIVTLVTLVILVTLGVAPGFSRSRGHALPVNNSHPFMGGKTRVHHMLQAGTGSWSGFNDYSFQWKRCNSGGKRCDAISGATGSFYSINSNDAGHTLRVSVTARNRYGSRSATSGPRRVHGRPIAPPSSANGSVTFDGRAKQMKRIYSTSASSQGQSPNVWTCLCFTKNDFSLVPDSTYGQAYKVAVTTGDTNPWGGSSTTDGAAQVSTRRSNDLGKWDYYGFAVKVPSWNGPMRDLFFSELVSLGYQTSQSSQVALGLWGNEDNGHRLSFSIDQNAGYANNANGYATGTVHYNRTFMPVKFGQWEEFVIGVKWATDNSGALVVYNRTPGGTWSKVFDRENEATELYGATPNGTFAADGSNWPTVIDKMGLYFQEYGGESETVYESGLTRASDLATAESTLP